MGQESGNCLAGSHMFGLMGCNLGSDEAGLSSRGCASERSASALFPVVHLLAAVGQITFLFC